MSSCSCYSVRNNWSSRRCRAVSKEVSGGQGKLRAPERWPESSGRGLEGDFLIEAFSCQSWSFSMFLGRFRVTQGGVQLRLRRSQEGRRSPELQNGGLRALAKAWGDFLVEAFSCQVWSSSVLLARVSKFPAILWWKGCQITSPAFGRRKSLTEGAK